VAVTEGQAFTGAIASFSAIHGTQFEPLGDFTATVDWGDGTAPTQGTIVATSAPGVYRVAGSHIYADSGADVGATPNVPSGTFPISVLVREEGGGTLLVTNQATVRDVAITLTGRLDPATDTGTSNSDAITNDPEPRFVGTSEPFSRISLFATSLAGGVPVLVGLAEADGAGAWSIDSSLLADGRYVITARAVDASGATTATTQILPGTGEGLLTIDTAGPQVTALRFYPHSGEIDVTFADGISGMDPVQLDDPLSFLLTRRQRPVTSYPVNLVVPPVGVAGNPETVVLVVNRGRPLGTGAYHLTILSGAQAAGIRDRAGNALDGEFYGAFPSGNHLPGGNFQAELDALDHRVATPRTPGGKVKPSFPLSAVRPLILLRPLALIGHSKSALKNKVDVSGAAR
jgi:hypothetical protein